MMRWSRPAFLVFGIAVLILGAWTLVILLSPAAMRPWTSSALAISVVLTVAQVLRGRRTITVAVAEATRRDLREAPPKQPARDYVVPFALPPAALVVGRDDELDDILSFLRRSESSGPRVVVVHGPPGIGKTALAIKAAHRCADDFADGVLFASLGGPVLDEGTTGMETVTAEVLAGFIDSLQGPNEPIPDGLVARRDRFHQLTRDVRGRVLIVLDDVPGAAALEPLLPAGDAAAVLVTAREPLSVPNAHPVELAPLEDRHAISVLREIVGAERIAQEEEAAQAIVRRAAGSPLALQLAAASLASRPYWTLAAAVENMELLEGPASAANGSMAAGRFSRALDLSFAMLTQEERQALTMLGLLDSPTFAPWMLAALLGNDVETAQRLSDRLVHARLLEHITDDATGVAIYRVLEHVRDYAVLRLRTQRPDVLAAARQRLHEQETAWRNRDLQTMLNIHVYPQLDKGRLGHALSHARDALAQARENIERARQTPGGASGSAAADPEGGWPSRLAATRLAAAYQGEGLALAALAEVLAELGGVDDAFEMAAKALGTGTAQAAPRALRCQGKLQRRQRRLDEAEKTFELAVEGARRIGDRAEEGRVWREMAILWACRGDTEEGIRAVERAVGLDLRDDVAARLLPSILVSRSVVLLDAADRAAEPERSDLLSRADRSLSDAAVRADAQGQRLWRAWIDYERARTARRLGHLDHSRGLAFRAMEEFTQMRHRYGTARCRLEVGRAYLDQQRPYEALPVLEEARLTMSTRGGRWIEAQTAVVLADAQEQVGRVGEAMRELALAIGLYEDLGDLAGLAAARERLDRLWTPVPQERVGIRGARIGSGRWLSPLSRGSRVS